MRKFATRSDGSVVVDYLFAAFGEQPTDGGRGLRGVLVRYGDVADRDGFKVRFNKGSLNKLPHTVRLNVQHDRSRPVAVLRRGIELVEEFDRGVSINATVADTGDGRNLMEGVKAGLFTGFSMEVLFRKYTWDSRDLLSVIEGGLGGVAVVDKPGFGESKLTRFDLGFEDEDGHGVLPGLF